MPTYLIYKNIFPHYEFGSGPIFFLLQAEADPDPRKKVSGPQSYPCLPVSSDEVVHRRHFNIFYYFVTFFLHCLYITIIARHSITSKLELFVFTLVYCTTYCKMLNITAKIQLLRELLWRKNILPNKNMTDWVKHH